MRTAGGTDTTGEGTFPYFSAVISNSGGVTGYYVGSDGETHGFVRTPDGTITEFDPTGSLFTRGVAINSAGAVTGLWVEEQMSSFACHGFLRAPGGTITSFDVPGAGSDCVDSQGTFSSALLPNGAIEGAYVDSSGVIHGFVGFPGAFTTFDVSASGTGSGQGTEPINNNPSGAITGVYSDANNLIHGFLRAKGGAITTFDAPGGVGSTQPQGINPSGAITGIFSDPSVVLHGFLYIP